MLSMDEFYSDKELNSLWNNAKVCQECKTNIRLPIYVDTTNNEVFCEHHREYYLLSRKVINNLLKYALRIKDNIITKYYLKEGIIYKKRIQLEEQTATLLDEKKFDSLKEYQYHKVLKDDFI